MSDDKKTAVARAYDALTQTEAWKDLVAFAEGELVRSANVADSTGIKDLDIRVVCDERGFRRGIRALLAHVEFKKQGI